MADEKPGAAAPAITTPAPAPKADAAPAIQPIGAAAAPTDNSPVKVKAIKSFEHKGKMRHAWDEDSFEVSRHDARSMHGNGLIDYADESDEKAAHDAAGKDAADAARARRAAAKGGVADTDKSATPLATPPIKTA
jgi:hypothetical protein